MDPVSLILACLDNDELDFLYMEAIKNTLPHSADGSIARKAMREMRKVSVHYGEAFRESVTPAVAYSIARSLQQEAARKQLPVSGTLAKIQDEAAKVLQPAIQTTYTRIGKLFPTDPYATQQSGGSPVIQVKAERLAKKNAGEMISNITDADRNRIKKIVADGIRDKLTVQQVADNILSWVNDEQMTPERARTIAQTETATALAKAAHEAFTDGGSKYKRWVLVPMGKVCEACVANAQMGKIGINESFSSGHTVTPAHPNCRCVIWYDIPEETKSKKPKAKAKGKRK